MIWGEWSNFIFFIFYVWKVSASSENAHISHQRLNLGKLFAKPHKTQGSVKGLIFYPWKNRSFYVLILSLFSGKNKTFTSHFTSKAAKVKILESLEGVSKVLVQTCLWAVLTSYEIMNQWMILTTRPWRKAFENQCQFLALNSPNCRDSCQGQIQIPPNPRRDLSTLKRDSIQSLDLNSAGKYLPLLQQGLQKTSETPE